MTFRRGTKRKAESLTKQGTHTSNKRRRTSNVVRATLQAPSARNQRRQIISNARAVAYLKRTMAAQRVWCDWQQFGDCFATVDPGGNYTTTWCVHPLTSFTSWNPVLRTDTNVAESSTTFLKRLQLNLRYSLNQSDTAQISLFIVTLRQQSAGYNPVTAPPVVGTQYIVNSQDYNARLNSSVFKCHYSRQLTLMSNAYNMRTIGDQTAGDPRTTFAKGQINLSPHTKVRAPFSVGAITTHWKDLDAQDVPYYQRYYMMVYMVQSSASGLPANSGARVSFDLLATTINSD